jgi:hypothetical protein
MVVRVVSGGEIVRSKSSNDLAMVDYATNSSSKGGEGGWGTSSMSRDSCVINDSIHG